MDDLTDWITAAHAGIAPRKFLKLLEYYQSPAPLIRESESTLKNLGLSEESIVLLKRSDAKRLQYTLDWLRQPTHHVLTLQSATYPSLLREIPDPPPLLYIKGNPAILSSPQLAVVGSRNPTHTGMELAADYSYQLVKIGLTITSGLAIGIDAASHRGALAAGGYTVAVLGSGLQQLYPKRNSRLAEEIVAKGGALLSEFPLQEEPNTWHFPFRNRIISGLSVGTLVIEAAQSSGSLITAKLAAEQGREVFAIPGSVHNALAKGCHSLIQQGAKLTQTIEDVTSELGFLTQTEKSLLEISPKNPHQVSLDKKEQRLLECVGFEVTAVDNVIERSGYGVAEVLALLLKLELKGYIRVHSAGYLRVK